MRDVFNVDVDRLRDAMIDDAGSAAFGGMRAAMADVISFELSSPEELVERASDMGYDLHDFEA